MKILERVDGTFEGFTFVSKTYKMPRAKTAKIIKAYALEYLIPMKEVMDRCIVEGALRKK